VPLAKNPKVVLKPLLGQFFDRNNIVTLQLTKIKYKDQCEELDEVFGHRFETRQQCSEVRMQAQQ
jgi:hypothetical protein